ncbi:hypothetical protein TSUD_148650 [Trifolium subterraneum]|uniref:Retrotransposon gag domain-containing protein n=1 Tax=Trifolium subterraneum TaxID=3900 RepID=A0A2Z6MMD0_TRISU|nr:hypothetical protein TSUD_148650 [Trifolium subterraneum]
MASGSNANNDDTNNNNVDVIPPFTLNTDDPVLMPVHNTDQPIPETDHRDGRETSPDSDDDDAVQFLSERKKGKQPQAVPEKSVNEQNTRIRALEQILGYFKPSSPLWRAERSESPPARRAGTSQRRPVLERVQPPPQRPRSPPRRKELLLGGMTHGSRGDDYQYRRENSPRREETPTHSPGWSDDEVYKGPLSRQIMDLELPRALQKPPQLGKYDGLTDPDIHIQNIDVILNYQAVKGGIKYRIFPTTLVEDAMTWYRSLPQGSITSCKDLCKQFTNHFTASRKHPKTEANLEAVHQGPDETLRSYIERFNKEAVQVDVTDDMKKYLMRKNLRDGTKFKEMFTNYTPLLVPREIVLVECATSDFKNAGIRFPKSTPFKPGQDRSRYCAYHKSYGHLTEDCIQLKDAIEILIRNGKLKDYVKRKENPYQEKKREDTPEDESKSSGEKKVAMAIWRPEDFYFPNYLKDTYEPPIINE